MLDRAKYKRVTDLYTVGTEVPLRDGSVIWVQVPNPFEYDEARHDAAVARSRLILSLKDGGDELAKLRASFVQEGQDKAVRDLVDARSGDFLIKAYDQIRTDPDWRERLEIMDRSEDLIARPPEDAERQLLATIAEDYQSELQTRVAQEQEYWTQHYAAMSEEDLWAAYQAFYIDRRGGDVALAEFKLTQLWYAARCCEGRLLEDGTYDHSNCEAHQQGVFATKAEVRALPEALQAQLFEALERAGMSERDAKNAVRQGSSSASSPLPSAPEASTASTPTGTPAEPRTTSPQPSLTP